MSFRGYTRALWLIAIVGCSGKRDQAEPPPPPPPRPAAIVPDASLDVSAIEAERYVGLASKLGEAVSANRTDCPAMAAALNRVLDANKQVIARGAEARAAGRELPPASLARIQQVLQKLAIDLDACVTDAAVQAAFTRYRGDADVAAEVEPAEAAKVIALVDQVGAVVKKHAQDCGKLAAGIEGVIAANRDVMRAAAAAEIAGKRLPPKTLQLLLGKVQAMLPLMKKCTGDPAVVAAFGKLQLGSH